MLYIYIYILSLKWNIRFELKVNLIQGFAVLSWFTYVHVNSLFKVYFVTKIYIYILSLKWNSFRQGFTVLSRLNYVHSKALFKVYVVPSIYIYTCMVSKIIHTFLNPKWTQNRASLFLADLTMCTVKPCLKFISWSRYICIYLCCL